MAYGESLEELVYVGIVGIIDPPREGVREAIETLLSTGISLKMVTGDAEETAVAIGDKWLIKVFVIVKANFTDLFSRLIFIYLNHKCI